jgi:hypothetical protein
MSLVHLDQSTQTGSREEDTIIPRMLSVGIAQEDDVSPGQTGVHWSMYDDERGTVIDGHGVAALYLVPESADNGEVTFSTINTPNNAETYYWIGVMSTEE